MGSLIVKAKVFLVEETANVPKPKVTLKEMKFKEVSRDAVAFFGCVSVYNPYVLPLAICEVSYTLKSAGSARVIVSGMIADPGSLSAKKTENLELLLKVPYDFLLSLLRNIARDWDVDYDLEIGLIIDFPVVGNISIPFSHKGELKLPTLSGLI